MRSVLWALLVLLVAPAIACGEGATSSLTGAGGGSLRVVQRVCSDDNLYVHHDGTFEAGVAWEWAGVQEPYYGAFGEAFDLGVGTVECVSLWITQDGDNAGQSTDVYVWEGGVTGTPGTVVALVSGIVFENIPVWPDFGRYDVEIPAEVAGEFTVGSWGNWPWAGPGYWWGVDQDGAAGHPWTYVMDGYGYPPGWQNPDDIWGPGYINSMGIGVHFAAEGTPAAPATWGAVKSLFASGR